MFKKNRKPECDGTRRGRELFSQEKTCDRKRTRVSLYTVPVRKDYAVGGVISKIKKHPLRNAFNINLSINIIRML